ncbi:putative RNA-binding protein Luc7-like 1 isoform X2 [Phymastichus coffea]|uniref:putative RNA-binding protein Luc7-like 1 isoform X2 n=1 Tax=Phymastichus coffea TaxID=108790 RepID=UPI00273B6F35|nr:putative RNA-binding protein Luc7-like 1 isoform X2 [Phymastichus coffea]XP_058795156.1 putative RNA-binding protein Luc7-like 1 isoform X2 [Phymastichus coffea]XP_058795157.1 putative RNA-binding protein Luc7-like 1 isoform X2 [Phymastichus coffea]XP_058795159.1 putative RNA-binding protein Luc7-like 1 isoform X2 [Phymastichus coffea]
MRFLRMDLGECPQIHDLALRADFEAAQKKKDHFYDIDAMEHLASFIADCDRRTEQAKQRLAETQEELSAEVAAKANAVHLLAEEIGKKLAKAEQLGEEGFVEESMKLMGEIDELRKRKNEAEQEYRNSMPASSYQQQKLRVCEVCSAYLGIHDNDRRLADHFGGKLHLGFIKIREKLADLEKTVDERRRQRRDALSGGRAERSRERRPERASRSRSRERDRARAGRNHRERPATTDRERRDRDRDRERDRDRDRDRRNRDRRRSRSRSRSRGKRSRRSRSDSRGRRSRSRRSGSNDRKR